MTIQTAKHLPATQGILACRIRQIPYGRGPSPQAGEVELENTSARALEILWDVHPLQYLNLIVTDARGAVVSVGHYADRFSPVGKTASLRLTPGAKYTHTVALLGTLPDENRRPGHYTVRAIYEYDALSVQSEPLDVELSTKGP